MEKRRKGEKQGPRITLGERAINWAKALAIVIPLIGVGAVGNSNTVKNLLVPEIEGQVSPIIDGDFNSQVIQRIDSIIVKLSAHDEQLEQLESASDRKDSRLEDRITAIEALVN